MIKSLRMSLCIIFKIYDKNNNSTNPNRQPPKYIISKSHQSTILDKMIKKTSTPNPTNNHQNTTVEVGDKELFRHPKIVP